jgi:hypothetical protein
VSAEELRITNRGSAAGIVGRGLTLRAPGTVSANCGQLLIAPETVDLGGLSFLDSAVSALARSLATVRQDVPGAPEGMSLTAVRGLLRASKPSSTAPTWSSAVEPDDARQPTVAGSSRTTVTATPGDELRGTGRCGDARFRM